MFDCTAIQQLIQTLEEHRAYSITSCTPNASLNRHLLLDPKEFLAHWGTCSPGQEHFFHLPASVVVDEGV